MLKNIWSRGVLCYNNMPYVTRRETSVTDTTVLYVGCVWKGESEWANDWMDKRVLIWERNNERERSGGSWFKIKGEMFAIPSDLLEFLQLYPFLYSPDHASEGRWKQKILLS